MKMLRRISFAIICIALLVMLQSGFILLMLAMLPSIMAYIGDSEKGKPSFRVVFLCNAAAFLPTLAPMLRAGLNMRHYDIMGIASEPLMWLLFYSGAAAGWGLIYLSRYCSRFLVAMNSDLHVVRLEDTQRKLVEEWGPSVTRPGPPPVKAG